MTTAPQRTAPALPMAQDGRPARHPGGQPAHPPPARRHAAAPRRALGGRLRARPSRRWRRGRGGGRRARSAPAASGGTPRRPPTIRGTSSRAHCAQRRRHRPARPRARALRGGDDGGRHTPLRPLAVLRRGNAVAASHLPALPSACADGGPRFGGRPHHAGERQLLPLRAGRPASSRAVATGRRWSPTRIS